MRWRAARDPTFMHARGADLLTDGSLVAELGRLGSWLLLPDRRFGKATGQLVSRFSGCNWILDELRDRRL